MPEEEVQRVAPDVRPESQGVSFEQEGSVEKREDVEGGREKPEQVGETRGGAAETPRPTSVKIPVAAATPSAVPVKDEVTRDIENILSEDLTDLFLSLPDDKKLAFKQKGEETAGKIREMIGKGKVKIKKLFELIQDWLKIVPGVNQYFLEQEAKIRADKLLQYAQEQEKASSHQV